MIPILRCVSHALAGHDENNMRGEGVTIVKVSRMEW